MTPEVVGFVGVVTATLLGGAGWLIKRRITADPARERAELYASLVDLSSKLQSAGLSLSDVRVLERQLLSSGTASLETVRAVTGADAQDMEENLPSSYYTNALMRRRAQARQGMLDNRIEELLLNFEGLWPEEKCEQLRLSYEDWSVWRDREADLAASEFSGGTMEPLAKALTSIKLSEDYVVRLEELLRGAKKSACLTD